MAVVPWTPGTFKILGDLVKPAVAAAVSNTDIENPGFEDGDSDWTKEYGWTIGSTGNHVYRGTFSAKYDPDPLSDTVHFIEQTDTADVNPGQSITARCMVDQGASSSGDAGASVVLRWYASDGTTLVSTSEGNRVTSSDGGWKQSTVTAVCPAGAAKVRIGARGFRNQGGNALWVDDFSWNLVTQVANTGLIFVAVAVTGNSFTGTTEPTWPTVNGVQVVDNEVMWEATYSNRVTWEAEALMITGATEPTWPTGPGQFVADNTVNWEAIGAVILDDNCPHSKVVAIGASHIFAVDSDITRFSAVNNPLDWTTEEDAGYLPTGIQQQNANDMTVLNLYRSNLVAFNASSFQMWQIDPDPAAMNLLDQMEGIGSVYQHAAQAVDDELLFLSQQGVRSVSIAVGASNLTAGDVGEPVDTLVIPALESTLGIGHRPFATYYPGAGQYWLAFPRGDGDSDVFVYTRNGRSGAWSRYIFPFTVTGFAQLDNDLYIRGNDEVYRVDEALTTDLVEAGEAPIIGYVWWPWLDFGQPGQDKMLEGFDITSTGEDVSISFGYIQGNADSSAFTELYNLTAADTVPGTIVPMPLTAPTISVKVRFGEAPWSLTGLLLYVHDQQPAA